jgi:hypothetical protein
MRSPIRGGFGIKLAGVVVVVCLAFPAVAGAAARGWGSCAWEAGLARDYERPLSRLPEIRRMPESGRLPFGPPALELYETSRYGNVVVGRGSFGYNFVTRSYTRDLPLGWTVSAAMSLLTPRGGVKQVVDRGRVWIGKVDNAKQPGISLETPAKPGFYRFDIWFEEQGGASLGRFSEYVRVVEPRLDVRLGINGRSFRAGETVLTRVNNLGTEPVLYGASFSLERFESSTWVRPPEIDLGPWPLYLGAVGPGGRGRCSGFEIPADLPAGRYRVVKEVGLERSWPRAGRSLDLTAWFDVTG